MKLSNLAFVSSHSIEALIDSSYPTDADPGSRLFTESGLLIVPTTEKAARSALEQATQQRSTGQRVGVLFNYKEPFDLMGYAKDNMMRRILWIGEDGVERDQDLDE